MDYKGTIYDFSDTSKMRGEWHMLLVITATADTPIKKRIVCEQIRSCHKYFQCLKCKKHFGRYLISHPPEVELDKEDGLFDWIIVFMNVIQERLGKELYDRNILYPMFHEVGMIMCQEKCAEDDITPPASGSPIHVKRLYNNSDYMKNDNDDPFKTSYSMNRDRYIRPDPFYF